MFCVTCLRVCSTRVHRCIPDHSVNSYLTESCSLKHFHNTVLDEAYTLSPVLLGTKLHDVRKNLDPVQWNQRFSAGLWSEVRCQCLSSVSRVGEPLGGWQEKAQPGICTPKFCCNGDHRISWLIYTERKDLLYSSVKSHHLHRAIFSCSPLLKLM